jgi:hypothetical protein
MSSVKFVVALGAVSALVGLFACGGSTAGGNTTGETNACLAAGFGSDCFSCMQTSCGPELSNVESACGDYLTCVCPGGSLSCSANASSACDQKGNEPACASAGLPLSTCEQKNCETACNAGGAECPSTSTACTGSASLDGGCANGQLLESCTATTGSTTSCYYTVGSQQFDCKSCTDTTSCEEAASAACK